MPRTPIDLGEQDVQTVTRDGTSVLARIHDVRTRTPVNHIDHRGSLFEIFNDDPTFWDSPVVYAYQTSVRPGHVKGWARHEHKEDRYTIGSGEILVVLYDGRPDSPTLGVTQKVFLSDRATRQIYIPTGVWHLLINLSPAESFIVNLPTRVYDHEHPDRILLPWDSSEIPVDVHSLLPKS